MCKSYTKKRKKEYIDKFFLMNSYAIKNYQPDPSGTQSPEFGAGP